MATQYEASVIGATHVVVGLSMTVAIYPTIYCFAQNLKILSGGGTLEIITPGTTLGPGTGATGWGTGYPIGANEVISWDGPARFYLAATGATMIASLVYTETAGASFL